MPATLQPARDCISASGGHTNPPLVLTSSILTSAGPGCYQRPPPRPPRSRPRPPPPLPARSVLGRASFTFRERPPTCVPFSAAIAFSPSSAFVISTKPKPRERPVSRSVMIATRSTGPYCSNNWRSSSSPVLKSRFPTKIFFKRLPRSGELFECSCLRRVRDRLRSGRRLVVGPANSSNAAAV